MHAWEMDFNKIYSGDQWQKALTVMYSSTGSANLWELFQKILLCWYLSPYRISKFAPSVSPLCWRHCGEPGPLIHLLRSCPKI